MIGIAIAQACVREDPNEPRIAASCRDYCEQARACDEDELDDVECRDRCEASVERCHGPEREQALDDLDHCAVIECEEISNCPVGAGLHCTSEL